MANLKIQLMKSVSGSAEDQVATIRGLGLGKLNSTRVIASSPSVDGMLKKVAHLVKVSPTAESVSHGRRAPAAKR